MILKGFGVYYVQEDRIKITNFNIISHNLEQDANAAVNGFRLLRLQTFFKLIDTEAYVVWVDCGKHFRNNEFVGYLLLELAEIKKHGIFVLFFQFCIIFKDLNYY
jgi:hypothetical protein